MYLNLYINIFAQKFTTITVHILLLFLIFWVEDLPQGCFINNKLKFNLVSISIQVLKVYFYIYHLHNAGFF